MRSKVAERIRKNTSEKTRAKVRLYGDSLVKKSRLGSVNLESMPGEQEHLSTLNL